MALALDFGRQPREWIANHPDAELVNRVLSWIETDLCGGNASVEMYPVPHRLPVVFSVVPTTDVAVTWFEAHPMATIKVLKIERLSEALPDI